MGRNMGPRALPDEASPASFDVARRVGRYGLVLEVDDETWVGVVLEGADRGRLVRVRLVSARNLADDELALLKRAGLTAMVIRHPKVLATLDFATEGDDVAAVSEYVEGESLRALQRLAARAGAPLPPAVALAVVRDMIAALRAARDQWKQMIRSGDTLADAVHGGLDPRGIIVATFGDTMLAEVGMAGTLARRPEALREPSALAYRAPEQLSQGRGFAERCDVFSVGVIAWELLANRPLFGDPARLERSSAQDPLELEKQVLTGPIPPLDTIRGRSDVPGAVVDLLRNALLRDPLKRYSSLDKLALAIDQLPSELFASAAQITAAVDRLARSSLEARRDSLDAALGAETVREGSGPQSRRSTARPPSGTQAARVHVPRHGIPRFDEGGDGATPTAERAAARRRRSLEPGADEPLPVDPRAEPDGPPAPRVESLFPPSTKSQAPPRAEVRPDDVEPEPISMLPDSVGTELTPERDAEPDTLVVQPDELASGEVSLEALADDEQTAPPERLQPAAAPSSPPVAAAAPGRRNALWLALGGAALALALFVALGRGGAASDDPPATARPTAEPRPPSPQPEAPAGQPGPREPQPPAAPAPDAATPEPAALEPAQKPRVKLPRVPPAAKPAESPSATPSAQPSEPFRPSEI